MPIDYLSHIASDSALVMEALRSGPLDARVPGCPDWSLADLAVHLGGVQRWATYVVVNGTPPGPQDVAAKPTDPAESVAYFEAGTAPLLAALEAADLEAPCWNFSGANQTKAFWPRRQALEVACHRWDAQSALGTPAPLDPEVAADCIDEFVHLIVRRVLERTKADVSHLVGDVHLHCTDTPGEWTFQQVDGQLHVAEGHGKAAAAVRGTASDLTLFLYNRIPADRVEHFGDRKLVDNWMAILRF